MSILVPLCILKGSRIGNINISVHRKAYICVTITSHLFKLN